jgi:nucleoside-diphosphate-sugar epimerase
MASGKPRVLVTGGAGYIGSVLVPLLLQSGHEVTVLDSFVFNQSTLLDCCRLPGFQVVRGDCRDERILSDLLPRHDAIIPLAALVGAPLCANDQIGAVSINRDAVASVCKLASKSQWILLPVSNSGYGIGEKAAHCTEDSPLRPISLYGETKVAAERFVLERENGISFRLATVFGASPRMRLDLLVNDFVYRAVTDRTVVLFEGHFKRNYVHVYDAARVFLHGLEHFESMRNLPYNVGLDEANLSKLELCERIQKHVPEFVFFEAPIGRDPDQRDYIVSNARLMATGYRPARTLDDGIQELIKAYRIVRKGAYGNS